MVFPVSVVRSYDSPALPLYNIKTYFSNKGLKYTLALGITF
jgi:hypothetical protein